MLVTLDAGAHPLSDTLIGGIGIRALELADTLVDEVQVCCLTDDTDVDMDERVQLVPLRHWKSLLADSDAVIFFDGGASSRLEEAAQAPARVVVENATPVEHLEYRSVQKSTDPTAVYKPFLDYYLKGLRSADHFLARAPVERLTLIANLVAAGRISTEDLRTSRTLTHLISMVPIGYSTRSSIRASESVASGKPVDLLWTGGLWPFYDPHLVVEALARCLEAGRSLTAEFMYAGQHPDSNAVVERLASIIASRSLSENITLQSSVIAHSARDSRVMDACCLVALAKPGIENETAVRLRIRDSRLYGIPLIADNYGATGVEVERTSSGATVQTSNIDTLASDLIQRVDAVSRAHRVRSSDPAFCYSRTLTSFMEWLLT